MREIPVSDKERRIIHIEVRGCIVNIQQHLHDGAGQEVTHVSILPDDRCHGEHKWVLDGCAGNRLILTRPDDTEYPSDARGARA